MEHDIPQLIIPDNIYELPHCEAALVTLSEAAQLYKGFSSIHDQIAAGTITLDFHKLAQYNRIIQHPMTRSDALNLTSADTGLTLKYIEPTDDTGAALTIKLTQVKTGKTVAEHIEHYQLFLAESGAPWCAMVFKVMRDRTGQRVDGPPFEESWHAFTVDELELMNGLLTFISDPANHFDENATVLDIAPKEAKIKTMRTRIANLFARSRRPDEI